MAGYLQSSANRPTMNRSTPVQSIAPVPTKSCGRQPCWLPPSFGIAGNVAAFLPQHLEKYRLKKGAIKGLLLLYLVIAP